MILVVVLFVFLIAVCHTINETDLEQAGVEPPDQYRLDRWRGKE